MENTDTRPLLKSMLERSSIDWGEAPKYTEEYRKLRWPGTQPPEHPEYENLIADTARRTPVVRPNPAWKTRIHYELRKKEQGNWNSRRDARYPQDRYNFTPDTVRGLMQDIKGCMNLNIPFKTKTYRYDPKTTTLYVGEKGEIHYSLETGCIKSFTYAGLYDKRLSLMLRRFGIRVIRKGNRLVFKEEVYENEETINLTDTYYVPAPKMPEEMLRNRLASYRLIPHSPFVIINDNLLREYSSMIILPMANNYENIL
jgi:hypothetical protein